MTSVSQIMASLSDSDWPMFATAFQSEKDLARIVEDEMLYKPFLEEYVNAVLTVFYGRRISIPHRLFYMLQLLGWWASISILSFWVWSSTREYMV